MANADFSILKPYFLLLYGVFGVICLCLAVWSSRRNSAIVLGMRGSPILAGLLLIGAAAMLLTKFLLTGSYLLLAAAAIGAAVFAARPAAWRVPQSIFPAAAAVTLVLSLVWWRIAPSEAAPLPLAAFVVILGGLAVGFSDPWERRPNTLAIPLAVVLIAGCLLLIDLGNYRRDDPFLLGTLALHWGAFIGPALHLRAGLIPFYDIPLQYGLGPTLTIAVACRGTDCWMGTEIIVVVMSLANALLIVRMALATAVPRGWFWQGASTIVVFAAVFLWPGYPADGSSLLGVPSVGGVRFLPTTLVACLLFFGHPRAAAVALVPAVLWSPESAAMAVAVFGLCETARIGLVRAALRSAGLLAGSYAGLILLHRAIFGVWVDPAAIAEYVLHVPGPLPIDPFSDGLLLAAVLALGGWLMLRMSPDPVTARRDRTATVLLFATASYWLGRSHPNNICNVAPFLVLVALRGLDRPTTTRVVLADATAFGLATSVAALAMSPWHSVPYELPATFNIHTVTANFLLLEPDIQWVRSRITNPQGLGIADFGPSYNRHVSETIVWTPMDPSSLWAFVPSERRRLYIQRSSARLRRSGWAIFGADQRYLFDDLQAGYTVVQKRSLDVPPSTPGGAPTRFIIACFDPRSDLAPTIVGPACPPSTP